MIASSPTLPMWLAARTISETTGPPKVRYRNKTQQPSSSRMLYARRRRGMKRFDWRSAMTRSAPDGRGLDDGDDDDDGEQTDLGWRRVHAQSSQRQSSDDVITQTLTCPCVSVERPWYAPRPTLYRFTTTPPRPSPAQVLSWALLEPCGPPTKT